MASGTPFAKTQSHHVARTPTNYSLIHLPANTLSLLSGTSHCVSVHTTYKNCAIVSELCRPGVALGRVRNASSTCLLFSQSVHKEHLSTVYLARSIIGPLSLLVHLQNNNASLQPTHLRRSILGPILTVGPHATPSFESHPGARRCKEVSPQYLCLSLRDFLCPSFPMMLQKTSPFVKIWLWAS
ncbi:hypothetical protein BD410DRAFT_789794 [Rickenella mellea]|uniref:Uncharacterized protein n=1 Tax=Rickenella mellea TaxID=50990 RepID=A0A4Y7Q3J0_9AGAM|nr:hypothetical protein BD410DRAFT_789794 [Rickenella mellea]